MTRVTGDADIDPDLPRLGVPHISRDRGTGGVDSAYARYGQSHALIGKMFEQRAWVVGLQPKMLDQGLRLTAQRDNKMNPIGHALHGIGTARPEWGI